MASTVIMVIIALIGTSFAQYPSTTSTSTRPPTTPTTWFDPYTGSRGNPGSRAFVCQKSMDGIHDYVSDMISRIIMGMTVLDLVLPVGAGILIVKPPRVTEANFAKLQYTMVPPNRIRSRFYDGRLAANGVWQYKPYVGDLMGGTYKATIFGTELNSTNQLGRSVDGKPTIQPVECKTNLGNFRIEIQGGGQIKVIEDCNLDICNRIRKFFEDTICRLFEGFVREVINRELQLVPNRINIQGDQYKMDYSLLFGEPTVNDTDKCIRAGMEGKYMWRGSSGVPFNAPDMEWVNHGRMYSFQISDFAFNTLLHQAHSSGHRFSAAELTSSSMKELLSLNCDGSKTPTPKPSTPISTTTTPKPKPTKPNPARKSNRRSWSAPFTQEEEDAHANNPKCLGSLFNSFSNFGPYSASDLGDIVFRTSQKAATIFIDSDKRAFFDCNSGTLEFYGPMVSGGNRPLLARADVKSMRGDFLPKMNIANVTGSIKLTTFQLAPSSSSIAIRALTSDWLATASKFSMPIVNDMINAFFDRFAQFPSPLPQKYDCISPQFTILSRTMQVDCDVQRVNKECTCECVSNPSACACEGDPKLAA